MANSKRKCKHCKQYEPTEHGINTPAGWFCCIEHAREYAQEQAQRKKDRAIAKKQKESRASNRKRKEALKTAGDYIKEAQAAVNKYVRLRDYGRPCICCGATMYWHKPGGAVDAGHYRSRGAAGHLRFNVLNIHAQSVKCNRFLSGNAVDYRINLIQKIGIEMVEKLESNNEPRKFTIDYLKRIKQIFNKRARWYEKRRKSGIYPKSM